MDNLKNVKKKMPPEKYNLILDKIKLDDIYLLNIDAKVDRNKLQAMKEVTPRITEQYEAYYDKITETWKVNGKLLLDVPTKGRGINPFIVNAEFCASFIVKDKVPKEFWDIYMFVTFPFQIWPYYRALVQDITSRMNLPPLTLPILKAS